MSATETVHVRTATPASTRAEARQHRFAVDKLESNGGTDAAPMASEYLLAAVASCQITTAHKIAAKRRKPLEHIEITATAHFADGLIERIDLDIAVKGEADADELQTIFRLTERACTISRALSVPVEADIRRAD